MTDDLHSIVRRVEALHAERDGIADDIAEVFRDAKKVPGLDIAAVRGAIAERRRRAKNPSAHEALSEKVAEYLDALDNGIVLEHARAPARARSQTPPRTATSTPVVAPQAERGGEGRVSADPVPPSPAGGATSDAGTLPTAAASTPGDAVPAGDPDAPTRANLAQVGKPNGVYESDADWERQDSAATFFVGHAVAGGKEPHPSTPDTAKTKAVVARLEAEARADTPAVAQIAGRALASLRDEDMPPIPDNLRRQAPSPRGM